MNSAWIGLGSNLGSPLSNLGEAVAGIAKLEGTEIRRVSPAYRTRPWGLTDQPDFVNAVIELETGLEPRPLLEHLLRIEGELGRERNTEQWGPRRIDLDLLVIENRQVNEPDLIVPHPRLYQRAFVLAPLNDLVPELNVPGQGLVCELLAGLDQDELAGLRVIADWHGSEWIARHREAS